MRGPLYALVVVLAGALGLLFYVSMTTPVIEGGAEGAVQKSLSRLRQYISVPSADSPLLTLDDVCVGRAPQGFELYGPPCFNNATVPALDTADRVAADHPLAFLNDGVTAATVEGDVGLFPGAARTVREKWPALAQAGQWGGAVLYNCDEPKRDLLEHLGKGRPSTPRVLDGVIFHGYAGAQISRDRIVYIYGHGPAQDVDGCLRRCLADKRCMAVQINGKPPHLTCELSDVGIAVGDGTEKNELWMLFGRWKPFLFTREYVLADVYRMKLALAHRGDAAVGVPWEGGGRTPGKRLKAFYTEMRSRAEDGALWTEFNEPKDYPDWRLPEAEAAKPCYYTKRFIAANELDVISFFHFAWVDPFHKIVFFVIPKVASTELVKLYDRALGMPDYKGTNWPYTPHFKFSNGVAERFRLGSLSPVNATLILNSPLYRKVVLFRDPLERVVSAYKEKKKIGALQKTYGVPDTFSFEEFVDRLANPDLKGTKHSVGPVMDPHYRAQMLVANLYKFLPLMDFIGWANGDHAKLMLEGYGLWESLGKSWHGDPKANFMQRDGARTKTHYQGSASKVDEMFTPELREKVRKALALDIALFEEIGLVPGGPPVSGQKAAHRGQRCDKTGFCLPGPPQCV